MRVMTHFVLWSLGLARAETQTSEAERDCLARHSDRKKCLVEIGVWHGVTTCRLRRAMAPDGVIHGVDPYPVGRLGFSAQQVIARREVGRIPTGNMHWMRCTGVQAAAEFTRTGSGPADFVFIDGDHSFGGLRGDWEAWTPLITAGGIVALHDSASSATRSIDDAGSVRFTKQVVLHDRRFQLLEVVDTLTVLKRLDTR